MKIYSCGNTHSYNNVNFGALKFKSEKSWHDSAIDCIKNNKELQKLVEAYEAKNIDIVMEQIVYSKKEVSQNYILVKDSTGALLSCCSVDTFRYDLFSKSFLLRDSLLEMSGQNVVKTNKSDCIMKKLTNFIKKIVKFIR